RHEQRERADAEVEILAEAAALHLGFEVAVGGADQAHVDVDLGGAADARELARLEDAEELGLERQRRLADLVEEERPARGRLEEADLAPLGAGEGAALVPEQLALEERLGERGAVELDVGLAGALAATVDLLGDDLLADAGLAEEEHGDRRRRDLVERLVDAPHLRIGDDEV